MQDCRRSCSSMSCIGETRMLRQLLTLQRLAILTAAFACLLPAQEYRSTMTGRITDPSGAAIPGVTVTAIKIDTNTRFPTVAGPEGFYTIPQLPPGTYEVTA